LIFVSDDIKVIFTIWRLFQAFSGALQRVVLNANHSNFPKITLKFCN